MRFFGKAALFSGRDANNMTAISVGIQRPRRFIKRFARLGVEDAQKSKRQRFSECEAAGKSRQRDRRLR
jgi:hypothetical protein